LLDLALFHDRHEFRNHRRWNHGLSLLRDVILRGLVSEMDNGFSADFGDVLDLAQSESTGHSLNKEVLLLLGEEKSWLHSEI
jgi:hypothetical protein